MTDTEQRYKNINLLNCICLIILPIHYWGKFFIFFLFSTANFSLIPPHPLLDLFINAIGSK